MQYINSNTTPREAVRQFGYLPEDMAYRVIESADFADNADNIANKVREGRGGAGEDCLQEHIKYLQDFAKRLRGDNRADLLGEIERIEQTQLELGRDTEYRMEQLDDAVRMLDKAVTL